MSWKRLVVALLFCVPAVAHAGSSEELAKEAGDLTRKAEGAFFNGKAPEADALLREAAAALDALKAQDPGYKSLGTLQSKYDRLKARVDQKLSKGAAAPKAASTPVAAPPTGGASGELSSGAVTTLAGAGREMDASETALAQARESLAAGDFNRFGSKVYRAEDHLEKARSLLDRAERSNRVDPNHPQAVPLVQRYGALEKEIAAVKAEGEGRKDQAAARKGQAAQATAALDEAWLPRIREFTQPTGARYIDYPMVHDPQKLAEQDRKAEGAQRLLEEYERDVPAGTAGPQLESAAGDLRSAVDNYRAQRAAGAGNMNRSVEDELAQWEKRFQDNKSWKEDSGSSLFVVRPETFGRVKQQIDEIAAVSPSEAAAFSARLAGLEQENAVWVEKRTAWEDRPRPFPEARMTSKSIEKEMTGLLEDRGWKVEKLVIVDKDWWVLKGEYRYLQAAVLSRDGDGPFWSHVRFKQDQHLAGYGPTELWETGKKVRLP